MNVLPIEQLADSVTKRIYELDPGLLERFGENGKKKCKEDNLHHFNHLKTAYELRDTRVFSDYAVWLNGILVKHGMTAQHLLDNFTIIEDVLREYEAIAPDVVLFHLSTLRAGKNTLSALE